MSAIRLDVPQLQTEPTAPGHEQRDGDLALALADCAHVVRHTRAALAAHRLVMQCAWCTRYLLGGQLLGASELPCHLAPERLWRERRVTHGVCDDCVHLLVEADAT